MLQSLLNQVARPNQPRPTNLQSAADYYAVRMNQNIGNIWK